MVPARVPWHALATMEAAQEAKRLRIEGMTYRRMAKRLAADGHVSRTGKAFDSKLVWRMLGARPRRCALLCMRLLQGAELQPFTRFRFRAAVQSRLLNVEEAHLAGSETRSGTSTIV